MDDLKDLWLRFNACANELAERLGRTSNVVGEYAEHLMRKYYGGRLLDISESSADIASLDGTRYQVKSRKLKTGTTTQLNVIRSWYFDYLAVVLFDGDGHVVRVLEMPVSVAKEYGVYNEHQRGWVITTTAKFLKDPRGRDLTNELRTL